MSSSGRWWWLKGIAVADKGSVVVGAMTRGMRWQLRRRCRPWRCREVAIASKPIVTCWCLGRILNWEPFWGIQSETGPAKHVPLSQPT